MCIEGVFIVNQANQSNSLTVHAMNVIQDRECPERSEPNESGIQTLR